MNKETIYIEPGDDITDILSRLKTSEKKVIALVPPKKPGVLLSSVNIKLIARAAKAEKKAVVLVTTDDSLTKLAMNANLPVAPSLKSRPKMPENFEKDSEKPEKPEEKPKEEEDEPEETDLAEDEDEKSENPEEDSEEETDVAEDFADEPEASKLVDEIEAEEDEKTGKNSEKSEKIVGSSLRAEKDSEKGSEKSEKKSKKEKNESKNPVASWIVNHKLIVIFGSVGIVGAIVFLIWAYTIAPRVSVAINVRTSSGNFSKNVTFTKSPADEKAESGIFYAHEEKLEKDQSIKFTATGQKDLGEKAAGTLIVYTYFNQTASFPIPAGTVFTYGGLEYVSTAAASLDLTRTNQTTLSSSCDNFNDSDFDLLDGGCLVSTSVSVIASAPGEAYNVAAGQTSGWIVRLSGLAVQNRDAITGGTSKIVTIVQQSDVDIAIDKMKNETKENGKNELLAKLSSSVLPIDASFKVDATAPTSTPAVGEEVPEGTTPSISSKTTYSILTADLVRVEEFIKARTELEEGRRMYSIGDPFVEYFTEVDSNSYTAKLKTTYKTGPQISETEVLDKISGEKIGRIEPILKDSFPGIASVSIEKSYFWVNSVPSDPNKVTINMEVEE